MHLNPLGWVHADIRPDGISSGIISNATIAAALLDMTAAVVAVLPCIPRGPLSTPPVLIAVSFRLHPPTTAVRGKTAGEIPRWLAVTTRGVPPAEIQRLVRVPTRVTVPSSRLFPGVRKRIGVKTTRIMARQRRVDLARVSATSRRADTVAVIWVRAD